MGGDRSCNGVSALGASRPGGRYDVSNVSTHTAGPAAQAAHYDCGSQRGYNGALQAAAPSA